MSFKNNAEHVLHFPLAKQGRFPETGHAGNPGISCRQRHPDDDIPVCFQRVEPIDDFYSFAPVYRRHIEQPVKGRLRLSSQFTHILDKRCRRSRQLAVDDPLFIHFPPPRLLAAITFSFNVSMPCIKASGRGGQPGI